jgi:crotonobetainyl-CoA:carnitine CoA-transferase CaiB-like acyl-CoA transferase
VTPDGAESIESESGRAEAASQATGALAGLRVIDLSRVLAGPLAAQMLSDHGADVIKVESPAGDETRRWGPPFLDAEQDAVVSGYYYGLNRNKRNIVLDLQTSAGRGVMLDLIGTADVVIENFKPGTMEKWAVSYDAVLSQRHRGLVYCRISGYGADGPLGGLPGYDAALQAYGGLMSVNGEPDGEPLRVGVPIVDMTAGNLAFSGILLALLERASSGLGQLVDITLLDAVVSILHPHSASFSMTGRSPRRTGIAHPHVAPYQVFPTAEGGRLFIAAASDQQFANLVDVLGRPELALDIRFRSNQSRVENIEVLQEALFDALSSWDAHSLAQHLTERGVPSSPVNDVGTALRSGQVAHREMFVDQPHYRGVGVPIKLSRSGSVPPREPALPGADTDQVLSEIGYDQQTIVELREAGALG